jgi:CRISPR system Cascade subunit CasE
VRFDGVLRVTDAARLVEAVRSGIGPAKAFGFGLLSLRRM